jgi:UDP-glucose 4-epimerase
VATGTESLRREFAGRSVLVTGGLGFIGSTLAIRLVELGAHVGIVDNLLEGHGGNTHNIAPVRESVGLRFADIRDADEMAQQVAGRDYIFHLAGQNDHVRSLTDPFSDIDINIKGTAVLLEACRRQNPEVRLVYTGTRGEYGPITRFPVDEESPIHPKGIYELSSLTAQKLFKIYHDNRGVRSVTLRLTNIYGERAQMRHNRFGVVNWFLRLALDGRTIPVYGDGRLRRDFLHVADTVEAILMCAACPAAYGEVFNIGHDEVSSFGEVARLVVETAGGNWELTPFSPERAALEPGDFFSDISKVRRVVGWSPQTSLRAGIERTVAFYRRERENYW